jgi:hypothetical protein
VLGFGVRGLRYNSFLTALLVCTFVRRKLWQFFLNTVWPRLY